MGKNLKTLFLISISILAVSGLMIGCGDSSESADDSSPKSVECEALKDIGDFYVFGGDILLSKYDENHKKLVNAIVAQNQKKEGNPENPSPEDSIERATYPTDWWNTNPWPLGIVNFYFAKDETFSQTFINNLRSAMDSIQNSVPGIKFTEIKNLTTVDTGLRVSHTNSSWDKNSCSVGYSLLSPVNSGVDHWGGELRLSEDSSQKEILHELCHALGMLNEQQRSDRDNYITVVEDNLTADSYWDFVIEPNTNYRGGYDYRSIMHADSYEGAAKLYEPTIITKDPNYQKIIGKAQTLSDGDINFLKYVYPGKSGELGYWQNVDHFCWHIGPVTRTRWVDGWVNVDHYCYVKGTKTLQKWVEQWVNVPHSCYRKGTRTGTRWVEQWQNVDHFCNWTWHPAGSCGGEGWPHQILSGYWQNYTEEVMDWFWTTDGCCHGEGWPHQMLSGYWQSYDAEVMDWFWVTAGSCGGSGLPHQILDISKGHWEDYQSMENAFFWTTAGSCGGEGWPHQNWMLKSITF